MPKLHGMFPGSMHMSPGDGWFGGHAWVQFQFPPKHEHVVPAYGHTSPKLPWQLSPLIGACPGHMAQFQVPLKQTH